MDDGTRRQTLIPAPPTDVGRHVCRGGAALAAFLVPLWWFVAHGGASWVALATGVVFACLSAFPTCTYWIFGVSGPGAVVIGAAHVAVVYGSLRATSTPTEPMAAAMIVFAYPLLVTGVVGAVLVERWLARVLGFSAGDEWWRWRGSGGRSDL